MPWIRPGLLASLKASLTPAPAKPKAAKRAGNPELDALTLEVRRLYEQENMRPIKIQEHLASLGHAKTWSWVYQTTQYIMRAHLIPRDGAPSYLNPLKATP